MDENETGRAVVDAAVQVHRDLGPRAPGKRVRGGPCPGTAGSGLQVQRQVPIPIAWRGMKFDEGFRADLIIEGKVIVELKSVESVSKAHKKQILTYLRVTG